MAISFGRRGDGALRVAVEGELDFTTSDLLSLALCAGDPRHIFLDLDEVTIMDSSGVDAITEARRFADANDVDIEIVNARGIVRRVLELTGELSTPVAR